MNGCLLAASFPNTPHPSPSDVTQFDFYLSHTLLLLFFFSFLPNTFIEVFFISIHAKQYSASIALLMTSRLEHFHHTHSYAHFPWQPQTPSYHQSSHASDAMKQQGCSAQRWKKWITFTVFLWYIMSISKHL